METSRISISFGSARTADWRPYSRSTHDAKAIKAFPDAKEIIELNRLSPEVQRLARRELDLWIRRLFLEEKWKDARFSRGALVSDGRPPWTASGEFRQAIDSSTDTFDADALEADQARLFGLPSAYQRARPTLTLSIEEAGAEDHASHDLIIAVDNDDRPLHILLKRSRHEGGRFDSTVMRMTPTGTLVWAARVGGALDKHENETPESLVRLDPRSPEARSAAGAETTMWLHRLTKDRR